MITSGQAKDFLDTSVVRPIMHGSSVYREYFRRIFEGEPKYISPFVEMEFKRSYLCSLIDFYFLLKLPTMSTVADVIAFASNEFRAAKLKASLQLAGQLFQTRKIPLNVPSAKPKALYALAEVIIRIHSHFSKSFTNTGTDSTRCARAAVQLRAKLEDAEAEFRKFSDSFEDTETCRSKCSVDRFIMRRHRRAVEDYIKEAMKLTPSPETNGFKKIGEHLEKVVSSRGDACSCRMCGNIGDAIISLDCNRTMILHHVDQSFDQLCPLVNQPHKKHPSETAVVREGT